MCFGGSKKSAAPPAPAPVVPQPNANNVADNSNTDQRQSVIASQTAQTQTQPQSFGAELGTSTPAP